VRVRCQIAGSSTLRRTHKVKSAGRTPTKNTLAPAEAEACSGQQFTTTGRERVANSPRALHEPSARPRSIVRPGFETPAQAPLAHSPPIPKAQKHAEHGELKRGLGAKAACRR
jgi:hypothetical protein